MKKLCFVVVAAALLAPLQVGAYLSLPIRSFTENGNTVRGVSLRNCREAPLQRIINTKRHVVVIPGDVTYPLANQNPLKRRKRWFVRRMAHRFLILLVGTLYEIVAYFATTFIRKPRYAGGHASPRATLGVRAMLRSIQTDLYSAELAAQKLESNEILRHLKEEDEATEHTETLVLVSVSPRTQTASGTSVKKQEKEMPPSIKGDTGHDNYDVNAWTTENLLEIRDREVAKIAEWSSGRAIDNVQENDIRPELTEAE